MAPPEQLTLRLTNILIVLFLRFTVYSPTLSTPIGSVSDGGTNRKVGRVSCYRRAYAAHSYPYGADVRETDLLSLACRSCQTV